MSFFGYHRPGYIAGRMTGVPNWNYDQFNAVAALLRRWYHDIENPAEHFGGDQHRTRAEYLRAALEALLHCDYVVLLPGWEQSYGANLEVDVALELGLDFYEFVGTPEGFWYLQVTKPDRHRPRRP
jgi:hypothetical protein